MVNSNRIKLYRFGTSGTETGSVLAGTSSAHIKQDSVYPINGKLLKVNTDILNSSSTGSLLIYNGSELIFNKNGIVLGTYYPRQYINTNTAGAVGGNGSILTEATMNDIITVVGSGLGTGSSFFCEMYYQT